MARSDRDDRSVPGERRGFATTRWSVVLRAGGRGSPESDAALATLCETYWYPLYAYVRRQGRNSSEAQDLVQGFFARLLEKDDLQSVRPERGRFRSFLLAAMKHFLINQWDRDRSAKRGGGRPVVPIDFAVGESRYRHEPAHEETAEAIFERQWALVLLDRVQAALRQEWSKAGRTASFDRLCGYLAGDQRSASYREAAAELGMTEGAVKGAVHRLRRRFRDLLRAEIAQTVAAADQVDEEIRALFETLRS